MAALTQNRELNPHLFGGGQAGSGATGVPDPSEIASRPAVGAYAASEAKALEVHLQATRSQVVAIEQNIGALASHMNDLARSVESRLERFGATLKRLEAGHAQQLQELGAKHATLAGKMHDRKVNDEKIMELIERHNFIVRNFENRLVTLARTLAEQELQLHASNAALDDARLELARMKQRG